MNISPVKSQGTLHWGYFSGVILAPTEITGPTARCCCDTWCMQQGPNSKLLMASVYCDLGRSRIGYGSGLLWRVNVEKWLIKGSFETCPCGNIPLQEGTRDWGAMNRGLAGCCIDLLPSRCQMPLKMMTFYSCVDINDFPLDFQRVNQGGGFKDFLFHPYLGKIPILTNIFQMGWNHQVVLVTYYLKLLAIISPLNLGLISLWTRGRVLPICIYQSHINQA